MRMKHLTLVYIFAVMYIFCNNYLMFDPCCVINCEVHSCDEAPIFRIRVTCKERYQCDNTRDNAGRLFNSVFGGVGLYCRTIFNM